MFHQHQHSIVDTLGLGRVFSGIQLHLLPAFKGVVFFSLRHRTHLQASSLICNQDWLQRFLQPRPQFPFRESCLLYIIHLHAFAFHLLSISGSYSTWFNKTRIFSSDCIQTHFFFFFSCCCCKNFQFHQDFQEQIENVLICLSLAGSSIHGILQARTLEWVAISFSRGPSQPRDQTQVSHIAGRRFNL